MNLNELKQLRRIIAERQRRAGVALADNVRLLASKSAADMFCQAQLLDTQASLLNRIEDYTQQLLGIDCEIEALTPTKVLLTSHAKL